MRFLILMFAMCLAGCAGSRDVVVTRLPTRRVETADYTIGNSVICEIHYAQMRHSRWTNLGYEVTPVRDDLYLVHLEWTIAGDRDPDGTPRDRRYGLFTWLTERRADRGRILAAHNSNLRPGLRHRLSGANLNHPSN